MASEPEQHLGAQGDAVSAEAELNKIEKKEAAISIQKTENLM